MLASRSERDALAGTFFFNCAHYALRPWPWILVALSSMLVFPTLDDIARAFPWVDRRLVGHDMAYPAMLTFMPPGLMGLMVAGLLSAYISTIVTHLNWGSSYLVHDAYRRFVRPGASEKHYVRAGRVATAVLMLAAMLLTFVLDSARQSFELLMSIGAGTGLIYLLRWFWWRINAWSEVAAMVSSFFVALAIAALPRYGLALSTHWALVASVAITTSVWIIVTMATRPSDRDTLRAFYARVRPAGPGWRAIRAETGLPPSSDSLAAAAAASVLGCSFVYAALFGTGSLLYGHPAQAVVWGVVFVASGIGLWRLAPAVWPRSTP
jgi:Na+/proline symporter